MMNISYFIKQREVFYCLTADSEGASQNEQDGASQQKDGDKRNGYDAGPGKYPHWLLYLNQSET